MAQQQQLEWNVPGPADWMQEQQRQQEREERARQEAAVQEGLRRALPVWRRRLGVAEAALAEAIAAEDAAARAEAQARTTFYEQAHRETGGQRPPLHGQGMLLMGLYTPEGDVAPGQGGMQPARPAWDAWQAAQKARGVAAGYVARCRSDRDVLTEWVQQASEAGDS